MAVRVAINGFGRIGRLVLRAIHEQGRKDMQVVAINDLGPLEANAHLLRYDTAHGRFPGEVKVLKDGIDIGNGLIKNFSEKDPTKLPWKDLNVDVLLECTGVFTDRASAQKHIDAGAKRVIISAPATDEDITVVYGVNDDKLKPEHKIISNASCTTNCLVPVAYVLHHAIGIERAFMTTIHSYTGDQRLQDTLHKDFHRMRAAAMSMIPTSTGAAKAVTLVLPDLKGKIDGTSIRVPTINVSVIDLKFQAKRDTTVEEVNKAILDASKTNRLKGVLNVNSEPLVSSDFNHDPASSTFDLKQTQVIDKRLVRILSWYDNEWGFSNRMVDVADLVGKLG